MMSVPSMQMSAYHLRSPLSLMALQMACACAFVYVVCVVFVPPATCCKLLIYVEQRLYCFAVVFCLLCIYSIALLMSAHAIHTCSTYIMALVRTQLWNRCPAGCVGCAGACLEGRGLMEAAAVHSSSSLPAAHVPAHRCTSSCTGCRRNSTACLPV